MKEMYEAPMVQVINMEVQGTLMQGSPTFENPGFGSGGDY